jgi:long-chain acyl-CoA synthetase
VNLATHLQRIAQAYPEQPAIAHGAALAFTYAEMADRASRLANGMLSQYRLKPGDRVMLVAENNIHYPEILYACWWAGLLVVPVNARLHSDEFCYIFANAGSRLSFCSAALQDATQAACEQSGAAQVVIDSPSHTALLDHPPIPIKPLEQDAPAWLFYTSGTTGRPKGATLSHGNLMAMACSYFADVDSISRGDAILHAGPMSHGSGLYAIPHVIAGGLQVVPESGGFRPDEIATLLEHWPNCSLFAAPTSLMRLVRQISRRPKGLKTLIYGGGPMYAADAQRCQSVLGDALVQIYGQGETPMTITCLRREDLADLHNPEWRNRIGSVGRANTAVSIRLVDEQGREVPTGDIGEVTVHGPTVMLGYWRNQAATQQAIRDGWLYTGDVGCLDSSGYLTLKDRIKDVIISGGMNIYPREVEEILLSHPGVREASVIGREDSEWGECVVAYVVGDDDSDSFRASLDRHCLAHLARFKRPKQYLLVNALPKNNYGKVLKTALRARDRSRSSQQPS